MINKVQIGEISQTNTAEAGSVHAVDQAFFIYYRDGKRSDVFGTKGAIAMLCLDLIEQHPELSGCRIGTLNAKAEELLGDADIVQAAAEYRQKQDGVKTADQRSDQAA